jgi:hypothetical protein
MKMKSHPVNRDGFFFIYEMPRKKLSSEIDIVWASIAFGIILIFLFD